MSVHYSSYGLNTYCGFPYFRAQIPEGYPLQAVLQKCRAFRRLPPNLKELARLAKRWAERKHPGDDFGGIADYYDDEGHELDPATGEPLTDDEINADWERWKVPDIEVKDIPRPEGGFADPDTWEPPPPPTPLVDRSGMTEDDILNDIESHGRTRTAQEYGVPAAVASGLRSDRQLARAILGMHGKPVPEG